MILATHANVKMEGEVSKLLDEFVGVIETVYEMLEEDLGDEEAGRIIALCGQLAFVKEDKDANNICQEISNMLVDKFGD